MSPIPNLRTTLASIDNTARVIVFETIELALRIGAYASEKLASQRVLISVEMLVRPERAPSSDRLADVVDYDAIHRKIVKLAEAPHVELQETLAESVARICLGPREVAAVEVYVRKIEAYPDCGSVGIRILRVRDDP